MEDYQEFLGRLQKRGSNPHRIKHCLGSRDAFMWVRRNHWKALGGRTCDKLLYSRIVDEVNQELASLLFEGHEVEFPYQMGTLMVNCREAKVYYKDGELMTNYKIDWKRTLDYLYTDEEARQEHSRVKRVQPLIYTIRYYKRKARYLNKRFYSFRVNRDLRRNLGRTVEMRKLNAEQTEY